MSQNEAEDMSNRFPRDDEALACSAMAEAIRLANATAQLGNVPVGAVVTHAGQIIARGSNLRDTLQDPTAHAEIIALKNAAQRLGSWRLSKATLYVTLEPCAMCAGAIMNARVGRLIYGAVEPKSGAIESVQTLLASSSTRVEGGVQAHDCLAILQRFFRELRVEERWPSG